MAERPFAVLSSTDSAREAAKGWRCGAAFAFFQPSEPEAFAVDNGHHVVFLGGGERSVGSLDLPIDVTPQRPDVPGLELLSIGCTVVSAHETVPIVVWAPGRRREFIELAVRKDGVAQPSLTLRLDDQGIGVTYLTDPSEGLWGVRFGGSEECFRCVRNDGALLLRSLGMIGIDGRLEIMVHLEMHGAPASGELHVLHGESSLSMRLYAGRARFSIPLASVEEITLRVGAHELTTRVVPPRSESVPKARASWADDAPVRLVSTEDAPAVELTRTLDAWRVVLFDPRHGVASEQAGGPSPAGTVIALEPTDSMAVALVGARAGSECWEGRATIPAVPLPITVRCSAVSRAERDLALEFTGPPGARVVGILRRSAVSAAHLRNSVARASRAQQSALRALMRDGAVTTSLSHAACSDLPAARPPSRRELREPDGPPASSHAFVADLDAQGHGAITARIGEGGYAIEVIGILNGRYGLARTTVCGRRVVACEFIESSYLPDGEQSIGQVSTFVDTDSAEVVVYRNRIPVGITSGGERAGSLQVSSPGAVVDFDLSPAIWEAVVATQDTVDRVALTVTPPGCAVGLQRCVRFLEHGQDIQLERQPEVERLEVLGDLRDTRARLLEALRDLQSEHIEPLCVVLVALTVSYVECPAFELKRVYSSKIRRLVQTIASRRVAGGFVDELGGPCSPLSGLAASHLLHVEPWRRQVVDEDVQDALSSIVRIARGVHRELDLSISQGQLTSTCQAYWRLFEKPEAAPILADWVASQLELFEGKLAVARTLLYGLDVDAPWSRSFVRAECAYGAALLLAAGGDYTIPGMRLANTVLEKLESSGRLYGATDSLAAFVLLDNLQKLWRPPSRCRVDGQLVAYDDARRAKRVRSVGGVEGFVPVMLYQYITEDHAAQDSGLAARACLLKDGEPAAQLELGDEAVLRIDCPRPILGDIVQVFLPDNLCMFWRGRWTRRAVLRLDLETHLDVPVLACRVSSDESATPLSRPFAVSVRNLYDEDRGKGIGDLTVRVVPQGWRPGTAESLRNIWKRLFR